MSLETGDMEIQGEVGTEAIVENNTEEIVQAAIDTAAAEAGSATEAVAITAFPKLAHAQEIQAVVAAAAREGGGGVQRRVVVVGNTAHLVTIHPAPGPTSAAAPTNHPPTAVQVENSLDLRVKEELLTVVAETQPESEPASGPNTSHTSPISTELNNSSQSSGTLANNPTTNNTPAGANGANGGIVTTMIDTSDFRMSEPTYQTLTTVNGRMTPPGYHLQGHYATLTPLQPVTPGPLPPISSIQMGEKFGYSPIVTSTQSSFTVMQNQSLAQISLASPYSYDSKIGMSPPHYSQNNGLHSAMQQQQQQQQQQPSPGTLSPQPYHQNGLHSPHKPMSPNPYDYTSSRNNLDPQSPHDLSPNSSNLDNEHSPTSDTTTSYSTTAYTTTPLTSANNPSLNGMASVSPHTISPVPQASPSLNHHNHHSRELSPPSPQSIPHPSPILPPTTILHHPNLAHHSNPHSTSLKSPNSTTSSNGEIEEINTKELAQRISAELKRYSIPQAIFAQRVLCRSQGTLSDLLRNPKPWSKLKSGRETFRRMWKWLQEPEFQRMSALRLAGRRKFYTSFFIFIVSSKPTVNRELSITNLNLYDPVKGNIKRNTFIHTCALQCQFINLKIIIKHNKFSVIYYIES